MKAPGALSSSGLALVSLTYWLVQSMLRPLVAPYAATEGATAFEIGVILAASAVPAFVLALPTGALSDQVGDRPLLIGGSAMMTVGVGLYAAVGTLPAVIGGQALYGVGALAVWLCVQRLMIDGGGEIDTPTRDRRIATYSMLGTAGQLAGPALGGVIADYTSYHTAFMVIVAICLLTFAFSWVIRPAFPTTTDDAPSGARHILGQVGRCYVTAADMMRTKGVLLTMAISFVGLYLLDVRTAFQPLYFDSIGLSPSSTGYLLSFAGACALLARPLLVMMRRRMRTGSVVLACLLPGAVATAAVTVVTDFVSLAVLSAIAGLSLGLTAPLTLVLTAEYTTREARGIGIGLRLMANRLSQWMNPALFSLLLVTLGLNAAFVTTSVILGAIAIGVAWWLNRTSPAPGTTSQADPV